MLDHAVHTPPVTAAAQNSAAPERALPDPPNGQQPTLAEDQLLVEDDLLIEDVSIDGMCGVY